MQPELEIKTKKAKNRSSTVLFFFQVQAGTSCKTDTVDGGQDTGPTLFRGEWLHSAHHYSMSSLATPVQLVETSIHDFYH